MGTMNSTATPGSRERPARPVERDEIVKLAAAAILGALWGVAWQRSAALSDIASIAPAMLLVIGPGLLVAYLGIRVATGSFEMRMTGWVAAIAVVAALVANLLTPGLSPSIEVPGTLKGTLDGVAISDTSDTACLWGPGRAAVIRVTYARRTAISANVPAGQLTIELPSGAVYVDPSALQMASPTVPLRIGSGGIGSGDRSTGTVTLDPAERALVAGELTWTCSAAPAS
jgi:hypothetical protein